jgi:predicted transcriptional regulator of viral defense system
MHAIANKPHRLGGLGEAERQALTTLAALERPTVTAADLSPTSAKGHQVANLMLSRLARKGWLIRLRRGVYGVVPLASQTATPVTDDPFAVAMRLFAPCYLSGWTAAEHWGLTEQVHNAVTVYSAKPQRQSMQVIGGVTYRVRRISINAIFGTTRIWSRTVPIEIATVHRTLIDVLDSPEMGGGGRQAMDIARAYFSAPAADPDELLRLAQRLGRGVVFKRLGFAAEHFGRVNDAWLRRCREGLSAGVSLLDPAGPRHGPTAARWRLRINVPLDEAE